jgi:hypothetical protein
LSAKQIGKPHSIQRDISILRGYERDHHLMLRTLIKLIRDGKIKKDDPILIIGPRYVDEVWFFRKCLGLKNTVGLDLFDSGDGYILKGDVHNIASPDQYYKLVFTVGTLTYSYNIRQVAEEMARVVQRPGFIMIMDNTDMTNGPNALSRSDVIHVDNALSLYYNHRFKILAKDAGMSITPEEYKTEN